MNELKPCAHCDSDSITDYSDAGCYPTDVNCTPSTEVQCDDCKVIAPSLEAWNRRASPWVRMEDETPPMHKFVLVWVFDCSMPFNGYYVIATYLKAKKIWIDSLLAQVADSDKVTHWMPIPPLGEENE